MKSVAKRSIERVLQLAGYRLPLGNDVLRDIRRIGQMWNYRIKTYFDVGANVGQTCLRVVQELPEAHIFAFEPDPSTFLQLKKAVDGVQNIEPLNIGFGTTIGEVDFFEYDMSLLNSMVDNAPYAVRYKKKAKRITVKSTTIDQFCKERRLETIDVLKIDTEGYELAVLKGAERVLSEGKIKFISAEFNDIPISPDATGGSLAAIDNFLRRFGFRFVASYTDWFDGSKDFFVVCNALFVLPPDGKADFDKLAAS